VRRSEITIDLGALRRNVGRLLEVLGGNDWRPDQLLEAMRAADARR
jgi:hypothetical protein